MAVGSLTAWDIFMKRIDILYDSSNEGRGKVAPGALVQGNTDDGSGFKAALLLFDRARRYDEGDCKYKLCRCGNCSKD